MIKHGIDIVLLIEIDFLNRKIELVHNDTITIIVLFQLSVDRDRLPEP